MKATVWEKAKKVIIYMGGDPAKNQAPVFTIELDNPQFQFDTEKNVVIIFETK